MRRRQNHRQRLRLDLRRLLEFHLRVETLQEFRGQAELVEGLRGGVLRVRVRDFNDRFGFSLYERKKERKCQ